MRLGAIRLIYKDDEDNAPVSFTLAAAPAEEASARIDAFKERLERLGFVQEDRFYSIGG